MKKTMASLICVLMLVPFATMAFAENVTTLTTTIPGAAYTLNIPADQTIDYGATETKIGDLTVTNSSGFAVDKNLHVTATYDDFACPNTETTIPFVLGYALGVHKTEMVSGSIFEFYGKEDGCVRETAKFYRYDGMPFDEDPDYYYIGIASECWGKAEPGIYTATINFTAEVVNA